MAATSRMYPRNNGEKISAYEKREIRRRIRKLQDTISENKIELVKEIIAGDIDVDFYYRGQTALQLAVREGHFEICRLLIDKGADVNKTDAEMNSLLNSACWRGHGDIAQLLIENRADVDLCNDNGASPLNVCALKGREDIVRFLIQSNCDLDILNSRGQTALFTSVQQGNIEIMKILLEAGCSKNTSDHSNRTPLILAASQGDVEATCILLQSGCDINRQDRLGQTALYHCASQGHLEVAMALIKAGADVNLATIKGFSPLLDSIRNNHIEVAKVLIEARCNINLKDRLHHAPIHEAIRQVSQYFGDPGKPSINIVELLVSAGADLSICDSEGWTPLYQAASSGDLEITKLLLNNGASLEVSTTAGETILHGGVYGNNPDIIELLIQSGCKVNQVNSQGQHPLMAAVMSRSHVSIVKALIAAGSDLNLPENNEQLSPLHATIHHHHHDAAILLINAGCDINSVNSRDQTPLHNACEKGKADIVAHILKQPHLNPDGIKSTALPLHAAAVNGHVNIVQMLLEAKFNINQLSDGGLTALQAGIQENKYSVSKTLLQYGCDVDAHAKVKRLMKCCLLQDDPHPHFALEPLFLALTHKDLDLMQLLLQFYIHIPYKVIKMLNHILKQSQELRFHYSAESKKNILDFFSQALKQPRLLQEICRCNIRAVLGSWPQVKVTTLPIANKLKNYILMTETFLTLEEQEKLEQDQLDQNGFVTV
ncbi:ankyrin-1-like [Haliotis asinina]|uniref:ankyrin-1-like n=1 Tax=Haliotis asinina TaxID=109174 RepID=UPI003531DCAD